MISWIEISPPLVLQKFTHSLANQTTHARIYPCTVNMGTAELEHLSEKKISSGQKQFCLRTTFTEFADNVFHDSLFSWGEKKANRSLKKKKKKGQKDIAGKIELIKRAN